MTLSIHGSMPHADGSIRLTDEAAARARMTFNPSGKPRVDRIKTLAAALYTEMNEVCALARKQGNDIAGREAATAMTHIQSGAMFAVSASTEPGFVDEPEQLDEQPESDEGKSKKKKKGDDSEK